MARASALFVVAVVAVVASSACGGSRSAASGPSSNGAYDAQHGAHHDVARGLFLVDLESAPTRDASADEVATMKKDSNDDAVANGVKSGHRAVFFFDFDDDALWFVVARALPEPEGPPMKRATRWKVEERLRVARSDDA